MSPLLQELFAYAAVALAGGWLLVRWRRGRRSAPACERCGSKALATPPKRGVRPRSLRVLR
ncbi:hypothetical protein [Paraliomyxa miuraensis]|uniref:hypothetical protein n=1 Tax=Paraliomyxa miuraensis TaxID=376150 RepID=UPI00225719D9|nr:hypothetical protein [Paraliomyxa miuraensis]MCX4244837.1 hypothetical protein [Paraliomyxa miuraensis]